MRELIKEMVGETTSWKLWAKQLAWSGMLTGLFRIGLWVFNVSPASTGREFAFWLVVPVMILASIRLLRGTADLRCNIQYIAEKGMELEGLGNRHVLILALMVHNRGDRPSGARGWKIGLTMAGSSEEHALDPVQIVSTDNQKGILLDIGGHGTIVKEPDLIQRKTFKAIEPGDHVSGYLCGLVPEGITGREITGRSGNKIRAIYYDVQGRKRVGEMTTSGRLGTQAMTIPGVDSGVQRVERERDAGEEGTASGADR